MKFFPSSAATLLTEAPSFSRAITAWRAAIPTSILLSLFFRMIRFTPLPESSTVIFEGSNFSVHGWELREDGARRTACVTAFCSEQISSGAFLLNSSALFRIGCSVRPMASAIQKLLLLSFGLTLINHPQPRPISAMWSYAWWAQSLL